MTQADIGRRRATAESRRRHVTLAQEHYLSQMAKTAAAGQQSAVVSYGLFVASKIDGCWKTNLKAINRDPDLGLTKKEKTWPKLTEIP